MNKLKKGKRLTLYVVKDRRTNGVLLYEKLYKTANQLNLSAVSLVKGCNEDKEAQVFHSSKFLPLSDKSLVLLDLVDNEEKIMNFLKTIDDFLDDSFITIQDIEMMFVQKELKRKV